MERRAPGGGSDADGSRAFPPPLPWNPSGALPPARSAAPSRWDDAEVDGPGFREPPLEFRTDLPDERDGGRGGGGPSARARYGVLRWIAAAIALLAVSALCAG